MHKVFGVFALIFVLFSPVLKADNLIPYYGEDFYRQPGLRDAELIAELNRILENKHQAIPGKLDRISPECGRKERCYSQISMGYSGVKAFLLSKYYVAKTENVFSITDVYCEKTYSVPGPNAIPDSKVINIEHTWPQSRFSGKFPQELQKADAHHLFPSDSEMNSVRGNFPFGEVATDQKKLKCPQSRFGASKTGGGLVFEPPPKHRGNVARALFYFSVRYHIAIEERQEAFLRAWHQQDPVDAEERERNQQIFRVQGNRNPFIDMPFLVDQIRNF